MNLYPLKFTPIYKEKIWGGNRLKTLFNRELPNDKIGESWEVAAHPNGTSTVKNGPLRDLKLTNLIEKEPEKMMGNYKKNDKFPLLVKILDANRKLSVQVHPGDEYALKQEGEPGKTEMWYVIDTEPETKLIYDLKPGSTSNEIAKSVKKGNLEEYLNEVPVTTGDILFMPAGTIHAIKEGILLAEIQQNSDTTYRVYDWNRKGKNGKPRALHIDRALEVIEYKEKPIKAKSEPLTCQYKDYSRSFLVACPYFVTEKIEIKNKFNFKSARNKFNILLPLTGEGNLSYRDKTYRIKAGESIFLPAAVKKVLIEGNIKLLRTYLPENKNKFMDKLKNIGFQTKDINNLAGIKEWKT